LERKFKAHLTALFECYKDRFNKKVTLRRAKNPKNRLVLSVKRNHILPRIFPFCKITKLKPTNKELKTRRNKK